MFAHKAREVVGIDVIEDYYIESANEGASESVKFLVVDADKPLPFSDDSFDVIYTKKGPWLFHRGIEEGHRIIKPGGTALGLYHYGRTVALEVYSQDCIHYFLTITWNA
jgi:SAM-dependent methyltransferase